MTLLLLLAACERSLPPPCDAPRTEAWEPVLTEETRLDESTATWEGTGIGECDGCVQVTGPGSARAAFVVNRGIPHRLVGTVTSTAGARVRIVQVNDDGAEVEIAAGTFAAGQASVELEFTMTQPGEEAWVSIEADAGTVTFDAWAVLAETWAQVDADPAAPLLVGFLIHVEKDSAFVDSPDRWLYRQQVIQGLADAFAPHGAILTVQPDATFVRAGEKLDPGWIADMGTRNVRYSVHVHAEDEGSAQAVGDAVQQGRAAFAAAGLQRVTDMNGGFGNGPWGLVSRSGIESVSAFKDPDTQVGMELQYVQPWRPADGTGEADPEAFATHDPDGPVLYLPGSPTREVDHPRITDFVARQLSQALAHTRAGFVNTWYFVLHVDNFVPEDEDDRAAYFSDGRFEADVAEYDRMLTEAVDPLVAYGQVEYASPDQMAERAKAWEDTCSE